MRVVHYLNQFFGGLGGEEKAGTPLEKHEGAVGPGKLLEQLLGDDAQVAMTLVSGDNYAVENQQSIIAAVLEKVREANADLFVAGPCFQAGRYGMAAGALCSAVQAKLGIPVIAGMAQENPGADLHRETLFIIDSGDNAVKMRDVLTRMATLAKKLLAKESVGLPKEEGYIPRGLIRDHFVEKTAAERLVEMVLAKVKDEPFESEMMPTAFAPVTMPPA
jgi:glycine reductase complex component B subunit gamma